MVLRAEPAVHVKVSSNTINIYAVKPGTQFDVGIMPPGAGDWDILTITPNLDAELALEGEWNVPTLQSNITINGEPVREPGDQGVVYAPDVLRYVHRAKSDLVADITDLDFVFECLFKTPEDVLEDRVIVDKRDHWDFGSPCWAPGWSFKITELPQQRPTFSIHDTMGGTDSHTGPTLAIKTWYHYMVFCDRDESNVAFYMRAYLNGSRLPAIPSGYTVGTNTIGNEGLLTFGSESDLVGSEDAGIAMVRVWTASEIFKGGAANLDQWDPVALAQYNILTQSW